MDLSIIIVNFNTANILRKCLKSLIANFQLTVSRDSFGMPIANYEIIVVDNGSSDNSLQSINSLKLKNLKIIANKTNLGFAKAVNQGIKKSRGEYILLLNSDVIVKPGAIEKMIDFVKKNPQAGVVGGRLLNPDGSPQGSCFYLPTLIRVIKEFWFNGPSVLNKYIPLANFPSEVEAVQGAVFLIPKKVLQKVGLFDERYFMYFEDLDYCRRVRQAGFKIYYLPKAEFIHFHGASGKQIPQKVYNFLVESSKIYHGRLKYYILTAIIWLSQKWRKILKF